MVNSKVGDKVYMLAFTGMLLGKFEVTEANKKTVTITQKNGRVNKFDRETGKQIGAKVERCASTIKDSLTDAEKVRFNKQLVKMGEAKPIEEKVAAKKGDKKAKAAPAAPAKEDKKAAARAKRAAKESKPVKEDEYADA